MLTLDKCLNKIVRCADGGYRRLIGVTERTLTYEVPTTNGHWIAMGNTPRHEVEDRFINGIIVEKVP